LLEGYGIMICEDMPDPLAGQTPIVFGNFKLAYEIIDRSGLRVTRDQYTNRPYVHFYSTKSVRCIG